MKKIVALCAICAFSSMGGLEQGTFRSPGKEFAPETWFHFIGGNVAEDGLAADLDAIRDAGIAGVQFFHGQFGGAWPGMTKQTPCLSEEWEGFVQKLGEGCEKRGLSLRVQNCPGWSMSGGPWIAPSNAMRKLVYSRVNVPAGKDISMQLPMPNETKEDWRDYKDIAVLAFPIPLGDEEPLPKPVAVEGQLADALSGKGGNLLPGTYSATVRFEKPVSIRSITVPSPSNLNHEYFCYTPDFDLKLEAVAGEKSAVATEASMPQGCWQDGLPWTTACKELASAEWRVTVRTGRFASLRSITLSAAPRLDNWEGQAGWTLRGLREYDQKQPRDAWISAGSILDLTSCMDKSGKLLWHSPEGRGHVVVRIGHVNLGTRNGPAPKEGRGWECDKLATKGADAHFPEYVGRLAKGPLKGKLAGTIMDSWECRRQTWTDGLDATFAEMRGYDLRPFMPALFGWVVDDPRTTIRFLSDWRRTTGELISKNYYGRMAELARKHGIDIGFETAFGDVVPGDLLEYWKYADVPMCEFWQPTGGGYVGQPDFKAVRPCISAARMYGKKRVAAEALTSFALTWDEKLRSLKQVVNRHLALGVTHMIFHTYTHNPRTDWKEPGTSFGAKIGTPFLRGQTWWKHMPCFTKYLSRCQAMLEEGQPVSDVLWYLGDEVGHKPPEEAPAALAGYKYDYCNPDALLNRIRVSKGKLVTPEGIEYSVLWLPSAKRMRPDTLRKVVELANDGAVVAFAQLPEETITLQGGDESAKELARTAQSVWQIAEENGARTIGKGHVYIAKTIDSVLQKEGIERDIRDEEGIFWSHRTDGKRDWYFVCAAKDGGWRGTINLRSTGKVELWQPEDGTTHPVLSKEENGRTLVSLKLPPAGSCFLVFDRKQKVAEQDAPVAISVDGKQLYAQTESLRTKVVKATYKGLDVAETLQVYVDGGADNLPVNDRYIERGGTEPKVLEAELESATGCRWKTSAKENEVIELLPQRPKWKTPVATLADDGKTIIAWTNAPIRVTLRDGTERELEVPNGVRAMPMPGPWNVSFPAGWGMRDSYTMNPLVPWNKLHGLPETPAFSGTATYSLSFLLGAVSAKEHFILDLGKVESIAKVYANGREVGTRWCEPYWLDVTKFLKAGINEFRIEVTDTWYNRLVFDAGQPEDKRKTWTIAGPVAGSQLHDTGLIGPVVLKVGMECKAK